MFLAYWEQNFQIGFKIVNYVHEHVGLTRRISTEIILSFSNDI